MLSNVFSFRIDRIRTKFTPCERPQQTLYIEGDFSSDARFFVAVGVLAFLYTLVAIVLYCFFTALYENNDLVPLGVSVDTYQSMTQMIEYK